MLSFFLAKCHKHKQTLKKEETSLKKYENSIHKHGNAWKVFPPLKVTTPHGFLEDYLLYYDLGFVEQSQKSLLQVFVQLGSLGKWRPNGQIFNKEAKRFKNLYQVRISFARASSN